MWCESVWQDFWRDLTLEGPVREWQRSRADVIRQETVTRAVMLPRYTNCQGQLFTTIPTDVCARSALAVEKTYTTTATATKRIADMNGRSLTARASFVWR